MVRFKRYVTNVLFLCMALPVFALAISQNVLARTCMPSAIYGQVEHDGINNNKIMQDMDVRNGALVIGYEIKEDKKEYKDESGNIRGIVSFKYPQFISTLPSVTRINKQIKKKSMQYFKSGNAKSIKEYTKDAIKHNRFYEDTEQYYWTTFCDISYNKDNIVSFHMSEWWYAGGVTNRHYYGLNYNLETGKELSVKDVITGNTKAKILKAAGKYCKDDNVAYKIIKNTKKYNFYFEEGTVYICYGSYELNHGPDFDIFTVKGKYK